MLNITRNFGTGDLQLNVAWTCSKLQLLDLVINYVFEDLKEFEYNVWFKRN